MKRKEIFWEDIVNGWLKYHDLTVEQLIAKHPKEVLSSPDWFKLYPVTQEQHDEWKEWAIQEVAKAKHLPVKYVRSKFAFTYLDTAPNVKD